MPMFRVAISANDGPGGLESHLGEEFVIAESSHDAVIQVIRKNIRISEEDEMVEPEDMTADWKEDRLLKVYDAKIQDLTSGYCISFPNDLPGECRSGSISAWEVDEDVLAMKQIVQQILDEGTDADIARLHSSIE